MLAGQRVQKLQLLGETADGPRQAARPGGEGRVTLLRIGAAVVAVVDVEDALVRHPAADVIGVAPLAVIDGVFAVVRA